MSPPKLSNSGQNQGLSRHMYPYITTYITYLHNAPNVEIIEQIFSSGMDAVQYGLTVLLFSKHITNLSMADPTKGNEYMHRLLGFIKSNWTKFTSPRKVRARMAELTQGEHQTEEMTKEVRPTELLAYYLAYYKVLLATRAKRNDPQLFDSIREGVKLQLEKCLIIHESKIAPDAVKGMLFLTYVILIVKLTKLTFKFS